METSDPVYIEPDPVIVAIDDEGNVIAEIDEINGAFNFEVSTNKRRIVYQKIKVDNVDYELKGNKILKDGYIIYCAYSPFYSNKGGIAGTEISQTYVSFTDFFKGASIRLDENEKANILWSYVIPDGLEPYLGPVYFSDIYTRVEETTTE